MNELRFNEMAAIICKQAKEMPNLAALEHLTKLVGVPEYEVKRGHVWIERKDLGDTDYVRIYNYNGMSNNISNSLSKSFLDYILTVAKMGKRKLIVDGQAYILSPIDYAPPGQGRGGNYIGGLSVSKEPAELEELK